MKILGRNAKGDKVYAVDSAEYDYLSTSGKLDLKGVYVIKDDRVYVRGGKTLGFTDAFGNPIGKDLDEWEQEEYRTLSQREKKKTKKKMKENNETGEVYKAEVKAEPVEEEKWEIVAPEKLVLETPKWVEDILKSAFED